MICSKLVCFLIIGSACFAQSVAPAFEVASVKLNRIAPQSLGPGAHFTQIGPECRGGRFIATGNTTTRVIAWAYDIRGINITGAIKGRGITPDTGKAEPCSMQQLALAIDATARRAANRQVVDHTGLPGVHEFNLRFDEFEGLQGMPATGLPDLRTALQE